MQNIWKVKGANWNDETAVPIPDLLLLAPKVPKKISSQLQHFFFSARAPALHTGDGDQQLSVQTATCLLFKLSLHRFSSVVRILQ